MYVRPLKPIESNAHEKTGMWWDGQRLSRHNQVLKTSSLGRSLHTFLDIIESQEYPAVLVGHNIRAYDNEVLLDAAGRLGLRENFVDAIYGDIDTLTLFRKERTGLGKGGYNQQSLVKEYLNYTYDKYDADENVDVLKDLVETEFCTHVLGKYIHQW